MKYTPQSRPLAVIIILAIAATAFGIFEFQEVQARPGSYVDSVTFHRYTDPTEATDSLIAGDIDMYYLAISNDDAQRVHEAGHYTYESVADTTYGIYLNPTDDYTNGFNPFALQQVRHAVNYIVDREYIVNEIIGAGAPMYTPLSPHNNDYLTIYREMGNFGFVRDMTEAKRLVSDALLEAGAIMSSDGTWHYDGAPIEISMFIRNDDQIRHKIGELLAADFEEIGFVVNKTYGNLQESLFTIRFTDPAEQAWHVYTDAWTGIGGSKYSAEILLGVFYAPIFGSMPGAVGGGGDGHWRYQNSTLDEYALYLYTEKYESLEQRAEWLVDMATLGTQESVRVFIAVGNELYPVSSNVEGIVGANRVGITSRYTPINVQLVDGQQDLDIGVRHVVQSAWNPVAGFRDVYSYHVWNLLSDRDFEFDPHTSDLYESRNAIVSVTTAGPDGTLPVPSSTIIWDPDTHAWITPEKFEAQTKVVLDLKLANWHSGQRMDLNDILFPIVFNREHHIDHRHTETSSLVDPHSELPFIARIQGVNILDGDTVEVYTNYRHHDEDRLAYLAGVWSPLPWEILYAMDRMIHTGDADWSVSAAALRSGNWMDMLDSEDASMAKAYLEMFMNTEYENHIPYFLYENKTSDYVTERYNASISWIDDKGHMVISNGPFYLTDMITRDADGDVVRMVLNQFDDPTYPLGPETWSAFTGYEPLSGEVQIGALAPVTGNAARYGEEIDAITRLAVDDFNEYLGMRSEKWTLSTANRDTKTSPDVALGHLSELNSKNINLVTGPAIDIITPKVLKFANDKDMTLVSCCSSVPSASIPNDVLFRMLPDQRTHAKHIVDLMRDEQGNGIYRMVPIAIDGAWAKELVYAAKAQFESRGGVSSDVILYQEDNIREAASVLASRVAQAAGQSGYSNVAVLYIGFGEGPEFLKAAAAFDVLSNVRWFGADQNTASPNIADDPAAAAFADSVDFTVVQPDVYSRNTMIYGTIEEYLASKNIEQSPYSSYQYDAVWVLGLSILNAQSTESAEVREQIHPTAMKYFGAIGSTDLDDNGDRRGATYAEWEFGGGGSWIPYVPSNAPAEPQKICR